MKTSSLKKIPAAKAKRATVRFGRPPKKLAGEVDTRILDAAQKVRVGFELNESSSDPKQMSNPPSFALRVMTVPQPLPSRNIRERSFSIAVGGTRLTPAPGCFPRKRVVLYVTI